jgi:hypothetical protein
MDDKRMDDKSLAGSSLEEDLFAVLGDSRLEALNEMKELQIMSRVLLQNEARRTDQKLGKDHPRSRALKISLEENLDTVNELEIESELAAVDIPEVDEGQTLIHGRVVDEKLRGIGGLFVSMSDEEGKTLRSLGRSETDASGYYALVIGPEALEKAPKTTENGVFLTVHTRKGQVVDRGFQPLDIAKGDHKLVEVVLDLESLIGGKGQPEYRPAAGREQEQGQEFSEEGSEPSDEVELEKILGIGPRKADQLRKAGIEDIQALLDADEEKLKEVLGNVDVQELKRKGTTVLEEMEGETGEAMASG